jgi:hypothetical protein
VHGGQLVVIEQRLSAGEVQVRDVATGVRSTVQVGSLRGREAGPLTELFDARDEQRRVIDEKDWVIARERERVVKELPAWPVRPPDGITVTAASLPSLGAGLKDFPIRA